MRTSETGIALIKESEGFINHVYSDNGFPAIAYGHRLLPGESFPDVISEAIGDALLRHDLAARFEPMVNPRVPSDCTQGQFDALVDFVYNIKKQPTSLEELLAHGWENVASQLPRWCNINEKPSPGLLARRQREVALFNS
jgi:lysozyme